MKRVLFIDHVHRILGGAERNLLELLTEARSTRRWEVACACSPHSPLSQSLAALGVPKWPHHFESAAGELRVVERPFAPLAVIRGWLALRDARPQLHRTIAEFRPDAVVSCTNKDHFSVGAVCRELGKPSLWWVNDIISAGFFPWPVRKAFHWHARREAGRLITVSEFARQALLNEGMPPDLVQVIHNGIPLAKYERQPQGALRCGLNLPENEPLIGIVGRFSPWKGQRLFLDVARDWISRHPHGHFILIGKAFNEEAAFAEELKMVARQPEFNTRVHFADFQENIAAVLSDLDVMIHASTRPEPFGRVIVEAMAVGVPVIAARDGGVPEIITNGLNGLLATSGDAPSYLVQLENLLGSPELSLRLTQNAIATVRERFNLERVCGQFNELLQSLD
jgi:glycosyltransferase involved in cell wall biosynthesis